MLDKKKKKEKEILSRKICLDLLMLHSLSDIELYMMCPNFALRTFKFNCKKFVITT